MAHAIVRRNDLSYNRGMPNEPQLQNGRLISTFLTSMRAQKRSQRTIDRYEWLLKRLADHLDPIGLLEADYNNLLDWQVSVAHLTPGSVAGYVSGVRVFYGWMVRPMRFLETSPAADLALPTVRPTKPRPMPDEDIQLALKGTIDPEMRLWIILGRYVGLRCCEIAWMRRDWIINDDDPLRIVITGKGNKQRIMFVDKELMNCLAPWLGKTGRLFLRDDGRPITPELVSDRINNHLSSLGLPYTAHQLRHRFGTDTLHRSKNLRLVQELMGHSSPVSTQVYTEVDEEEMIDIAHQLGDHLRSALERPRKNS